MIRPFIASILGAVAILSYAYFWLALSVPAHGGERICGRSSWYGGAHNGRHTASGEIFDDRLLTGAMLSPKHFGEVWRVTHGNKSVEVKINDTGGFAKYGRVLDLSRAAFARLAHPDVGVISVCAEKL